MIGLSYIMVTTQGESQLMASQRILLEAIAMLITVQVEREKWKTDMEQQKFGCRVGKISESGMLYPKA